MFRLHPSAILSDIYRSCSMSGSTLGLHLASFMKAYQNLFLRVWAPQSMIRLTRLILKLNCSFSNAFQKHTDCLS